MINYKSMDLSGKDFTKIDLTDKNLSHSDLSGCKFGKCIGTNFVHSYGAGVDFTDADITNSTFEKSTIIGDLIGASWRGVKITTVTDWLTKKDYWCFRTNAFVQCGCMQKTLEDWIAICQNKETIATLGLEQPGINLDFAFKWWQLHCETIINSL